MAGSMPYQEALGRTRSGDIWLFRGHSAADRAIRFATNSPVNHVGMVLALDDLPPLLWHAELGASLEDVWAGAHQRGAQLHRLADAVSVWAHRYGQRAWFRQIDVVVSRAQEDEALRSVAELDGRSFPRTGALARNWLKGRLRRPAPLEDLYCAELVAITYERMGLLGSERPQNWYDPGKFWSGDRLHLIGASLGTEIAVTDIPPYENPGGEAGRSQD